MTHTYDAQRREPFGLAEWLDGSPLRPLASLIERVLGLTELNRLYCEAPQTGQSFADDALDVLRVRYDVRGRGVIAVPKTGPLIVVSNHPFGALDGLCLLSLLARVRSDVRVMGNRLLGRIPGMSPLLIAVDPFGDRQRRHGNSMALRSAVKWVTSGGALMVFPAGEVAHSAIVAGQTVDPKWPASIGRLIALTEADVLPVFVHGHNSAVFRLAGKLHPRLRTALLPRELLKQRGRTIKVEIGSSVPPSRLAHFKDPDQLISYLRMRTFALAESAEDTPTAATGSAAAGRMTIAGPQRPDNLEREVLALDKSNVLLSNGPLEVYIARSPEVPRVLLEIGRLREITFRGAGEGSGQSRDLDRFDGLYRHLFIWHRERREIVGAYRIGATDEILAEPGIDGLYTSTLFRYDTRLLSQIDPALELGRAFVREEYQKDYSPLMLLWKGIGAFVARHPRYRMLFGPVSISNRYQSLSRQILVRFLYATSYRADLADLVRPRNPPLFLQHRGGLIPAAGPVARTLADVGAILSEIESDRKGVPVLLRQYLKLHARLLGFNLDRSFGNVLDGLMLVDLMEVDQTMLVRYMGASGAAAFRRHHGAHFTERARSSR